MGSIKFPHASGNSMGIAAPATNPASDLELKLPATVGTANQYLKNSSTPGTLEFGAAGGITEVDHWRVTSGWTGNADPIASNWERCDTTPGISKLGTGLTESSGVFSFPSTGIWQIYLGFYYDADDSISYACITVQTTVDNWSSSSNRFQVFGSSASTSGHHGFCFQTGIIDVTNTTNVKFRLRATSGDSADTDWIGDSNDSKNYLFAVKLAET